MTSTQIKPSNLSGPAGGHGWPRRGGGGPAAQTPTQFNDAKFPSPVLTINRPINL